MKHKLRSAQSTEGRRMAGARALWVANGMKREQFGRPIVASSILSPSSCRGILICMKSGRW